jgi:hypothetical protein
MSMKVSSHPPQTIISAPVQVGPFITTPVGIDVATAVGVQLSAAGS